MNYYSTRSHDSVNASLTVTLDQALNAGLAPDGGLYVPSEIPRLDLSAWTPAFTLAQTAALALTPFFQGSSLLPQLGTICEESLNLPMPQVPLSNADATMLELFHGPTAAFKDFAARFLSACLQRLQPSNQHSTVLVATSGDTGGAVAAAFHQRPGFDVKILFPEGRVSPRQAHQLCSFGGNVRAYRVQGSFDDCQALVKQAFSDNDLRAKTRLISANSISLGRLLPQMAYYVDASLRFNSLHARSANIIIPSGNLGHGLGAIMARALGAPIDTIVLATNENRVLADFFAGHTYRAASSKATLANAMDVGNPSNFERLQHLFGRADNVLSIATRDHDIRRLVHTSPTRFGHVVCPHTACALHALELLAPRFASKHWMLAATAHPAKFNDVVDQLLQREIPMPDSLADMMRKPANSQALNADYSALRALLLG
jgi:threonine synthase